MSDQSVWSGSGGKFEKHSYYRRPSVDGTGRPAENPGWITIQGNNLDRMRDLMLRGFEPLGGKFGTIEDWVKKAIQSGRMGRDEPLDSPWRPILEHPDGPAIFPAEQVLQLRWYKEDCPVPGTKFPQLGGHHVAEYQCPECNFPAFPSFDGLGGVDALARHLRFHHSWDRASLVKYGDKVGIDFDAIYSAIKHEYSFDGGKTEAKKKSGFDCPDCDWTPKANAKRPALALSLHAKEHEFTVETV